LVLFRRVALDVLEDHVESDFGILGKMFAEVREEVVVLLESLVENGERVHF
jgi:hypothetical protein